MCIYIYVHILAGKNTDTALDTFDSSLSHTVRFGKCYGKQLFWADACSTFTKLHTLY